MNVGVSTCIRGGGGDVRNNNLTNVAILVQLRGNVVGITREYKKKLWYTYMPCFNVGTVFG